MPVIQGKVTRCDIRIPNHLYEQIEAIAVSRFDAKIHWKSKKPEVSSTILELIKYGIECLSDRGLEKTFNVKEAQASDPKPIVRQTVSDLCAQVTKSIVLSEELQKKYQLLSDRVSDIERRASTTENTM
jgi:hypothetical protein